MNKFHTLIGALLIAVACSSPKKTLQQIDGTWKIEAYQEIPSNASPGPSLTGATITFEPCSASTNRESPNGCIGSIVIFSIGAIPIFYQINHSKTIRTLTINVRPEENAQAQNIATTQLNGAYEIVGEMDKQLTLRMEQDVLPLNGPASKRIRQIVLKR